MEVLVTYDVATETAEGRRRLRRVAQVCKDFGQRVQKSVFECLVDEAQYEELLRRLLRCIDDKKDSLRVYRLREPKGLYVKEFGLNQVIDFEGALVI